MKKLYYFLLIVFVGLVVQVQTFGQSTLNYTVTAGNNQSLTDMSLGTTQLIGPGQVTAASAVTNIGFDFFFMGVRYSQFSVNTNGLLRFGPVAIAGNDNTPVAIGEARIAAFTSRDIVDNGRVGCNNADGDWRTIAITGKVHYKVTGAAPNRVMTVEWKDMEMEAAGTLSADGTFQIRIYETFSHEVAANGGRIEIVYGSMTLPVRTTTCSINNNQGAVMAGISGDDAFNDYLLLRLTAHPSVAAGDISYNTSTFSSSYTASNAALNISSNNASARKFYNFTSVVPVGTVTANAATCINTNGATLTWTPNATTNAIGFAIFRSTDATNYSFVAQVPAGTTSYSVSGLNANTTYYFRIYPFTEGKLSTTASAGSVTLTTLAAGTLIQSVKSGNWSDPTVWSSGAVPTATDNVQIGCTAATAHAVAVNTTASCRNLTIITGFSVTFAAAQTLTISGNLVNNGSFDVTSGTANLAGNLTNTGIWLASSNTGFVFNGSAAQSISNAAVPGLVSVSGSGPVAIPENSPTGGLAGSGVTPTAAALLACATCAYLEVPVPAGNFAPSALQSIQFSVTHPWVADLDLYLMAPDNNKVWLLADEIGSNGDDFTNTIVADGGAAFTTGTPPYSGTFDAEDASTFASYAGPYNGNWRIYVIDDADLDIGTINSLRLTFLQLSSPALVFRNITVNNTSSTGVTQLDSDISIVNNMTFTDGVWYTGDPRKVIFADNATATGAGSASFVEGWVQKTGNDAFTFPLGRGTVYGSAAITAPALATDHFTATYYRTDPNTVPYNISLKDAAIHHVGRCEYWMINRTAGTSNVSVSLRYDNTLSCGTGAPASLLVARWDGSQWRNHGNSSVTGGMVRSLAAVTAFSPFTLGSSDQFNLLPVTLMNFEVVRRDNDALLEWKTATEQNNAYFSIERSVDGNQFTVLSTVKGALTSNQSRTYHYTDAGLPVSVTGVFYYRIRQHNTDHTSSLSEVRSICISAKDFALLKVYPNPFSDHFSIDYTVPQPGAVVFELVDALGKTIHRDLQYAEAGNHRFETARLAHLTHGVYMVRITYAGKQYYHKVVR